MSAWMTGLALATGSGAAGGAPGVGAWAVSWVPGPVLWADQDWGGGGDPSRGFF